MTYRVDLAQRAGRDLGLSYATINAEDSDEVRLWFNGLERTILSRDEYHARGATTPEARDLRLLLYGSRRHRYRIIYAIDDARGVVTVLHIRHGSRAAFDPDAPDDA